VKYEPAPGPSKLEHVLEYLARELRRLAGHTHDEPYWDDLRTPATAITPPGLPSDPQWDTSAVGWLFDQASPELLHIVLQMPHTWRGGTIRPHVHWEKTTSLSGSVAWQIAYQWCRVGEARDAETTLSATTVVAYTAAANTHLITKLGDISASGAEISDILVVRLSRDTSNPGDNYSADARLLEFDIHYQVDSPGSLYEYVKR
jgi:hypothetical protein